MNKHWPYLLIGFLAVHGLRAQDAVVEPLVKSPPPGSSWQIKINNPEVTKKPEIPPAQGKPNIISVPVLVTLKYGANKVILGEITFSDGHQDSYYAVNSSLLVQATVSKRIYALSLRSSEQDPLSVKVGTFPGIAWVSKATYKNSEKKNGVDCQHYLKIENFGGTDLKLEVWIGQDDKYPVEAKIGDLTYSFGAATPLEDDIVLPDEFRKALAEGNAEQSALDAMRKGSRR